MGKNPWAFEINYDAAIREDEAKVAALTEEIAKGWYAVTVSGATCDTLLARVLYVPGDAAKAGLTPLDVADLAAYWEVDFARPELVAAHGELPNETPGAAGYVRGKELVARLLHRWLCKDEVAAKTALKKAKARLARHKRNKEIFGR